MNAGLQHGLLALDALQEVGQKRMTNTQWEATLKLKEAVWGVADAFGRGAGVPKLRDQVEEERKKSKPGGPKNPVPVLGSGSEYE